MPDKRTVPDPAGRAPRRKRSAPTIDLTATEVTPAATETSPPSEPSPAQEQPRTAPGPEAHSSSESGPPSGHPDWLSAPALAAGFFAAALTAGVLAALWFSGALPVRSVASNDSNAITQAIDALAQRVAKIEGAVAKLPADDPSVSERLAAADNSLKSLGVALTALNKRNNEVADNVAEARARADAAEKAMTQLRDNVQNLSRNTSAGLSPADLDTVQKRLAALEQAAKVAPADNAARLALSTAALRDAVASGAPFARELDEVKSLGADEKSLAPLTPLAAGGVATVAALARELQALVPALVKASGAQAPAGGYLERLEASAAKLVRIRPVDAPVGNDASAVLARVEKEAAGAAIDDALIDLGKLDAATRAPAEAWIAKARARQVALAAARELANNAAHALGRQ